MCICLNTHNIHRDLSAARGGRSQMPHHRQSAAVWFVWVVVLCGARVNIDTTLGGYCIHTCLPYMVRGTLMWMCRYPARKWPKYMYGSARRSTHLTTESWMQCVCAYVLTTCSNRVPYTNSKRLCTPRTQKNTLSGGAGDVGWPQISRA